jgi:hypothetical protein
MSKSYGPPQILIVVQGGVVTEVFSSIPIEVLILDNDEYPDETVKDALSKLIGELTPQVLTNAIR